MPIAYRLLEFNRPAHSPWLTVALAEYELELQRGECPTAITLDPYPVLPEIDYSGAMTERDISILLHEWMNKEIERLVQIELIHGWAERV